VADVFGARTVLGFGAAWSVFGTLVMFTLPSIRHMTWRDTPTS